jgi:hypothetical protein
VLVEGHHEASARSGAVYAVNRIWRFPLDFSRDVSTIWAEVAIEEVGRDVGMEVIPSGALPIDTGHWCIAH